MSIDWFKAPPVPVEVVQCIAANKPLGGQIITGPRGQQTFVPDKGTSHRPIEVPVSYSPGGGVYATAK